jgi:hypothetical protein
MVVTRIEIYEGPTEDVIRMGVAFEDAFASVAMALNVLASGKIPCSLQNRIKSAHINDLGAIIARLYYIDYHSRAAGLRAHPSDEVGISKVLGVMVESAMLYTACQFVFFVLVVTRSLALTPISGFVSFSTWSIIPPLIITNAAAGTSDRYLL